MKKKIGKGYVQAEIERPIIVFGTERIGMLFAMRSGLQRSRIVLCTAGGDPLQKFHGGNITVVRTSTQRWHPPTFACEKRTAETEQAIKAFRQRGGQIEEHLLD